MASEQKENDHFVVNGVTLSKEDLAEAYRAFQRFDKDDSGAIDTKVQLQNRFQLY